ncbi:hypothetical protein F4780DRAFT_787725 [Xylariomycetidae sp. FL0641]|nr:hypothetical protein F4780DRAFT_787725 [Xylariomycetidae sp. FL0641]
MAFNTPSVLETVTEILTPVPKFDDFPPGRLIFSLAQFERILPGEQAKLDEEWKEHHMVHTPNPSTDDERRSKWYGVHYKVFDQAGDLIGQGGVVENADRGLEAYCSIKYASRNEIPSFFRTLLIAFCDPKVPRQDKQLRVLSGSVPEQCRGKRWCPEQLFVELDKQYEADLPANQQPWANREFEKIGELPNGNTYWRKVPTVKVRTTLPNLKEAEASKPQFDTEPLKPNTCLIRFREVRIPEDLDDLHEIKSNLGRMDMLGGGGNSNPKFTQHYFTYQDKNLYLKRYFVMVVRTNENEEGKRIGWGGIVIHSGKGVPEFPMVSYILSEDYEKQGIAFTFVEWLHGKWWKSFTREETEVEIPLSCAHFMESGYPQDPHPEYICAEVDKENSRSLNLLKKNKFEKYDQRGKLQFWRFKINHPKTEG